MIVAIGHQSGVGKDTAAKMLVSIMRLSGNYREVQKTSFATPLKDTAFLIWGCHGLKEGWWYEEHPEEKDVVLPSLGKSARQLWIELGQGVRAIFSNSWRDAALGKDADNKLLVIPDMRFNNEFQGVKDANGLCIKIESRRGTWHAADHELKGRTDWDHVIENDGTLSELHGKLVVIMTAEGLL